MTLLLLLLLLLLFFLLAPKKKKKKKKKKKLENKNNPHRQLRLGHSRLWLDSQSYRRGAPARQREWSASEMVVGMAFFV